MTVALIKLSSKLFSIFGGGGGEYIRPFVRSGCLFALRVALILDIANPLILRFHFVVP